MNITKLPVFIVSGFLGSGKTTFINNLLENFPKKKIAIIENEFGSLGIDSSLIKEKKEDKIFELNNGCICCTKSGELDETLKEILEKKQKYDFLFIETTGVANLSPILSTFLSNPNYFEYFKIYNVITIIDCKNFFTQIEQNSQIKEQISYAETIFLNKIDLVSKEDLKKIENQIKTLNTNSNIYFSENSKIDSYKEILENYFSTENLEKKINNVKAFSFENISNRTLLGLQNNKHLEEISSFYIISENEVTIDKINFFIETLLNYFGDNLFRIKGIFNIKGSKNKLFFQAVHKEINWSVGRLWREDEKKENKIVFIGKKLSAYDISKAFQELVELN